MIRFRMLGTLDLRDSQGREIRSLLRSPKLLALLSYLAMARPAGFHRRDTLIALLWPDLDHAHARNALRQAVHSLREALGQDVLVGRGEDELGINQERLWCDVREFEAALAAGDAEQSLELYGGGLFSGLHVSDVPAFDRWLDEEREHVRRRGCEAGRLLSDREEAAGNPAGAARWARRLTELSPSDENAVRRLIQLLDRSGDRAGAVRAQGEFERRLPRDLELEREPSSGAAPQPSRAVPEGAPVAEAPQVRTPTMWRARVTAKRITAVLALGFGALLAGGWLIFGGEFGSPSSEAARSAKRLVVLPFVNLGSAGNAYFAAGMTEELTARLAVIDSLRVIGSTSANHYKTTNLSIPSIGKELGVDYILEGSVRWDTSAQGQARVRVIPQLVNTIDGTNLWAQVYDEPVDEIFRVQSEIARKVAQALDLTLLAPQRRAVSTAPTASLEAYRYYLQGNEFQLHRGTEERFARAAVRMYQKAVESDSRFALAYAMLARAHNRMYWMFFDRSESRRAMAKQAVDKAFELEPGLPEAHHSLGAYYMGNLEFDRALEEFAIAEGRRPNETNIFMAKATVRMRQGKPREALVEYEKARQLDPVSSLVASTSGQAYDLLRDFPHAEAQYARAIALAPDRGIPYFQQAWLYVRWDGNTRRARAVVAEAHGVAEDPFSVTPVMFEILDRRPRQALHLLAAGVPELVADQFRYVPRAQLYGQVYGLLGRPDLEKVYYDSARAFVSRNLSERPDDPRLHSALGIAYAGLGRKQDAIREGRQAVQLLPISKEAYRGYYLELNLARIYAMVGEQDAAIDKVAYLLSIPGHLTAAWLRIDPVWDSLRGDRRFRRLADRGT